MVETTWTEEQATGPKKRSIPTWLWFCGGGCLLAVLLGVVAIGIGFRMLNEARDVEKQWPRLTQILPCDDPRPPPEMQFVIGTHVAGDQYQFLDSRGFQVQFQNHTGTDGTKARKDMFAADNPKFPQNLVVMKFEDIQPGTVEVQGRTLRLLRMRMELPKALNKMIPEEGRQGISSMAFVDLTPEGREGMLLVQFQRMKGTEPVADDEIREILKPFHVGPDR